MLPPYLDKEVFRVIYSWYLDTYRQVVIANISVQVPETVYLTKTTANSV